MEITRTFDLLERYRDYFMKEDALVVKQNKEWIKYSTQDYIDNAYNFSFGLMALGLEKGDKIATISNNRPEWNFVDIGMAMLGVIHVPLYSSLSSVEYKNILQHAESRLVFISDDSLLKVIKPLVAENSSIKGVYTFDPSEDASHWQEIVVLGKNNAEKYRDKLENIKSGIIPEDFASLIYTSGTTGSPKGVMLSHNNIVRNFLAASKIFDMQTDQKYLSTLPLCHVGGRMGNYQSQYSGCSIYYAESMGTLAKDMREISPHGFDAVPRILEKIFDTILSKGKKLKGIKKMIFFWAVQLGLKYKVKGESSLLYRLKLKLADKLIFSKWREAIGGNIESVGCGGSALQARVERVFWAAGIKVLNMYGLTETSPIITINRKQKPELMLGSVGSVIEGVEIRIAEDGEILCKGHNVMMGYYKNPESTKKVITDDGWFRTGDTGNLENNKFLKVTGRKKEIFKLSHGKYIVPQRIENIFKESLFIEHMIVVGEHEKFAGALIAADFTFIRDWCKVNNINAGSHDEILQNKQVIKALEEEIQLFNKELADFEKIKKFRLVPENWSAESGELSPTLKLKRNYITEKYQHHIDKLYNKRSI